MKIVKLLRMGALLAAAIAFVGCEMTLNDEDSRKEVVEAKAKANAASGSGSGGGSTGTVEVDQNNVDGTYTAVAKKDWSAGAAGTMDLTSFDTSKGVALSFKIENTTTDQTCVFQADGNIQICAGYVWLSDEMGGGFFEGDNTITENTWEKAIGSHYETVCFNTDGSVDWYLDGVLTFKWTGKSTQVENLFKALKAGVVNILPQTNSTTDVTVSKISYSSALTAAEAKALYDKNGSSSTPAPTTDNSSQGENTGTNNSGNNGNNNSGNTENNNNSGNSGTTIPTQTDYVVGTEDNTTSWSAGKNYTIAKGETQTVYFKNYGKRTGVYNPEEGVDGYGNWNNFLVELFNADSCGVTLRADNFGWNYGQSTNREFSWANEVTTGSKLPDNWADWVAAMNGAIVKLEISYKEGTITFKATSADVAGWAQVYSFANCTSDSLSWHFNVDKSYLVVLK